MKKNLLLLIPALGISYCAVSQQLSPDIVATDGGYHQAADVSLEWTLGEAAVETISTPTHIYTQGFHQPGLQVTPMPVTEASYASLDFQVAPNPVLSVFTVLLPAELEEDVQLILTDMNGKALLTGNAGAGQKTKDISLEAYASGLYFLHIRNTGGASLRSFKIIKAQ